MNKQCTKCGEEYDAKRSTSKYCGDKCRKLAFLEEEVSVPTLTVPDSVPEKIKPITAVKVGVCHGCKQKVHELVCICNECIRKGVSHEGLGLDVNDCDEGSVKNMSDEDLRHALKLYEHDTWKDSPEYKEVLRRNE